MNHLERNRADSVEQIAWGNGRWLTLTSWSLSLIYMATIFSLSAQSDLSLPYTVSGGVWHFGPFAFMGSGKLRREEKAIVLCVSSW